MWNALKLNKGWEGRTDENIAPGNVNFSLDGMEQRLAFVSRELNGLFKDFRLSEALKTIYSLVWDDFCSWYLEWIKPGMEQPMSLEVYNRTVEYYEQLLQLLHPFMPFITEEIYHQLRNRNEGDDLMVKQLPADTEADTTVLRHGSLLQDIITAIRDNRNKNGLKPKDTITLWIDSENQGFYDNVQDILRRQVNAENIGFTSEAKNGTIAVVVHSDKFYIEAELAVVDTEKQKEDMEKELTYLKGFLVSVEKKLSNDRFVQNAKPEIIDNERKKQADAMAKIKALEESLSLL
jgi:valyl-tRNA synthetase